MLMRTSHGEEFVLCFWSYSGKGAITDVVFDDPVTLCCGGSSASSASDA